MTFLHPVWTTAFFDTLASTQDEVRVRAQSGAAEGLVVQAAVQTAGRGRHGRVWDSQPGNLYMSVLLRPGCPAAQAGQIGLVVGLAAAQALRHLNTLTTLKWPNDLMIEGKKCGGILIEAETAAGGAVDFVIAGLGVNLAYAPEDARVLGLHDPAAVRNAILERLAYWYALWREEGFAPIRAGWLAHAHPEGAALSVKIAEKPPVSGAFAGLDAAGNLLLRGAGFQVTTVTAGEVFLPHAACD